jgi:hypothetical protein
MKQSRQSWALRLKLKVKTKMISAVCLMICN